LQIRRKVNQYIIASAVTPVHMNSFFFTLVLQNAGVHLTNLEDLLFDAGCSDALICSYRHIY
ncbi:MAG: hypothetical protein ACKVJ2_11480, partial [Pseudomonadales bacterium]